MANSAKIEAATGIVTVALGAVSGSFSPADLHEWGTTFLSLSPFLLILFLVWRIHQLDKQHKDCTANQSAMQSQINMLLSRHRGKGD